MQYRGQHVALIVPCYNEESAIESVVREFREAMPEIDIYVVDNNSSDHTSQVAAESGAKVISVSLPGKGNVVRRMFADVEADIYVMVDGDATYEAGAVRSLVDQLLDNHLDMVVGCRKTKEEISGEAYRRGHQWGNYMLTHSVVKIFGGNFNDMLSGYRAFTRRYVKSFPAISRGFEIETELTVHALELRMPYGEVMTAYGVRPEGSVSKLSTYRDGLRILKMIARLYITERPFAFFGICALVMAMISVILGFPLLTEFLKDGLVPRLPTAVLAASIMIAAALSFVCGLILDNVTRGRHEMKRLVYLGIPLPSMRKDK